MSLFRGNKPKINIVCLFQKEGSRRTKLGAICLKTKKNHKNKKLTYKSYKTAGQKLKIKKFIEIKSERKCKKRKKKEKAAY